MSPPPEVPHKRKVPESGRGREIEGIDLDDFDDPDEVAGMKAEPTPPPKPEPPAAKAPAPPPAVAAPRPAPVRPVVVAPAAPPPRPAAPAAPPPPPAAPPAPAAPAPSAPPPSAYVAPEKFPPPAPPAVRPPAPPPGGGEPWTSPAPAVPATAAPPVWPPAVAPPQYPAQLPGAPPIYMAPPYGYAPAPAYYPQPAYYPGPYGYPPPPIYYQQPVVYSVAPPPPARVWHTREALARLNGAAAVGLCAFLLLTLQRAFEAATGITDAPGSRATAALGMQALSLLLIIALGLALSLAMLVGGSGMYRLHKGRSEFGEADSPAYRRALKLLAISAALPTAALALGWLYLDNVQHTLPGSGTISNAGLSRLWDQYRTVVLVNALAGLAGAFCLVKGLQAPARGLTLNVPHHAYRLFALEFVAAAATNAAMVLIAFFAVMVPPQVGVQAAPPAAILLLLPGPVIAAHALFQLRIHLSNSLKEVERLALEKPPAAPPAAPPFA